MKIRIISSEICSICIIIVLLTLFIQNSMAQRGFQKGIFNSSNQDHLLYRILCPENNLPEEKDFPKYPLVIFLHGSGERGSDNEKQIIHIKDLFLNKSNRIKYPAFIIAPQCPEGKMWVDVEWDKEKHIMPEEPSGTLSLTMELIDSLLKKHPIDTNRIYITGLSMGGFGVWDAIARYPDMFAAAIPICGGGDENTAEKIKNIPIWAFHGSNDKVVHVERSRNMINALRKTGASPLYTEYKGVGHGSWFKAYKETELLKWLFTQSKDKK